MKKLLTIIIRSIILITIGLTVIIGMLSLSDFIKNSRDDKACASQERGHGYKVEGDRCIIYNGGDNQTKMGIETARQAQSIGYKF